MRLMKASATVGGFTLLSRITGFLRDLATASFLGAGPMADAFFVALKLPNFFRRLTAEGAFSVSFVPMFAGTLEQDGREAAIAFAQRAQAVMLTVMIPFTVIMIALMPWVLYAVAPGFQGEPARYDLALELARITFPYILFMSLVALIGGIMNSFDRFGPFAAAPVLFNFMLIGALYAFTPITETPAHAMAWGVFLAGIIQLVWMIWCLRKLNIKLKIQKPELTPDIRKLFRLMGPGVVAGGVIQITAFIDTILATFLPAGSVSYLYYADRLYQMPLSIIGVALGTALLPILARKFKNNQMSEAQKTLMHGIEIGLVLALPCAIALLIIAHPILDILFVRGAFTHEAAAASANAIQAFAIGIPAFVMVKVLSAAFFAKEDTMTPVKFALIGAAFNTVLSIVLMQFMAHVGIALASTLTACLNMVLLGRGLMKRGIVVLTARDYKRLLFIITSSLVMGVFLFLSNYYVLNHMLADSHDLTRFMALGLLIGIGGVSYLASIHFTKIYTVQDLIKLLRQRHQ